MQFMVLTRRKTEAFSEAQFAPLLEPEAARVRELYAEGFVRQVFARGDMGGAVHIIEAADAAEVEARLHTLPLHVAGMLEIVALVPLKPYRGFCPAK